MLIQRVNRTDAEKVYIVVKNSDASSITTGLGAMFAHIAGGSPAASVDGAGVLLVTGASAAASNEAMMNFAGIAAADIPSGSVGLVQNWGYCNSIAVSHRGANTTIGAGLIAEVMLMPSALAGTFTSTVPQDALSVYQPGGAGMVVMIADTVVLSLSLHSLGAYVWAKGFVRGI